MDRPFPRTSKSRSMAPNPDTSLRVSSYVVERADLRKLVVEGVLELRGNTALRVEQVGDVARSLLGQVLR